MFTADQEGSNATGRAESFFGALSGKLFGLAALRSAQIKFSFLPKRAQQVLHVRITRLRGSKNDCRSTHIETPGRAYCARESSKAKEAQIVFLQKKRERAVELQAKGAGTAATLDEADANYRVAAEELREAESNRRIAELDQERAQQVLNQRAILSPVDGVVAERNLVGGEYAYEQAPIMTVAQTDPLNVEVFVPISLYGSVHAGMEAAIIPQEPIGGAYKARVELIDPLVDSRSGTFGIRLVLPNPQGKIPAGLRCKVEFPVVN